MSDLTPNEKKFLIGLEKLTRETGIIIGGCGCCGSPWLEEAEDSDLHPNSSYVIGKPGKVTWVYPKVNDKGDKEYDREA